jgi:hypothetical protein
MDEDQAAKQRRLAAILAGLAARGLIILGTSPEEMAEKLSPVVAVIEKLV